jgi:hypothetical protein
MVCNGRTTIPLWDYTCVAPKSKIENFIKGEKKMIVHYYENVDIYAKCKRESENNCCWLEHDLEVGKMYEVERIDMGQSHTSITLKDKKGSYNSVIFDFYEGKQQIKQIDIYRDKRFNPYIR